MYLDKALDFTEPEVYCLQLNFTVNETNYYLVTIMLETQVWIVEASVLSIDEYGSCSMITSYFL